MGMSYYIYCFTIYIVLYFMSYYIYCNMRFVSVCLLQPVVCGSFLPQGLIPRPKSWESCHPSNELQQKAKVGHSLGLLTLPTDALSAASFEIDGTLANEKGRVGKPCFSSSKEAIGASSADSIVHSSFPLGIQRLF